MTTLDQAMQGIKPAPQYIRRRVCNRVLKNPKHAALGIGPVCLRHEEAEAACDESLTEET